MNLIGTITKMPYLSREIFSSERTLSLSTGSSQNWNITNFKGFLADWFNYCFFIYLDGKMIQVCVSWSRSRIAFCRSLDLLMQVPEKCDAGFGCAKLKDGKIIGGKSHLWGENEFIFWMCDKFLFLSGLSLHYQYSVFIFYALDLKTWCGYLSSV